MWRERTGSDFAILETSADAPAYTASQFDFDGESGIDVSLARDNGYGKGFDVRYLWIAPYASDHVSRFPQRNAPCDESEHCINFRQF